MWKKKGGKAKEPETKAAPVYSGPKPSQLAIGRITSDLKGLQAGDLAKVSRPNPDDLMNFVVTVYPNEGFWKGGKYEFSFGIPHDYPMKPPSVMCLTPVYHPNIDLDGKVCLNILKEGWTAACDVCSVIYGLIYLFEHPNEQDPLNKFAAQDMVNNLKQFGETIKKTLNGHSLTIDGQEYQFPRF